MTNDQRDAALRQMLNDRLVELQDEIRTHLRQGRSDRPAEGRDDLELSDDQIRGDLSFALLQMKSETIEQVEAALERLEAATTATAWPVSARSRVARLRALPFAVRCQPCAERRERSLTSEQSGSRWGPLSDTRGGDAG